MPTGAIVSDPARGTFTGNRGILHGPDKVLGSARWRHKAWICCVLDWQDRKRPVMAGRKWTELFFLDEAVALAAGHRPCAYCRRADYNRFCAAWDQAHGSRPPAPEIDKTLHAARVRRDRRQITHIAPLAGLPDGCFVAGADAVPTLIWNRALWPFQPNGYGAPQPKPTRNFDVTVLTPAPLVAVLAAGYRPKVTTLAPNH